LKFDVQSAVPAGSEVLEARMWLYLSGEEGTATKYIAAHRITAAWNADATWNTRDGANAWTTPGGDYASSSDDTGPTLNGSTSPGWKNCCTVGTSGLGAAHCAVATLGTGTASLAVAGDGLRRIYKSQT
jgi:hypothetical protein